MNFVSSHHSKIACSECLICFKHQCQIKLFLFLFLLLFIIITIPVPDPVPVPILILIISRGGELEHVYKDYYKK